MEPIIWFVTIPLLVVAVCGPLGAAAAAGADRRNAGAALGFLLGPLGVGLAFLLRPVNSPED